MDRAYTDASAGTVGSPKRSSARMSSAWRDGPRPPRSWWRSLNHKANRTTVEAPELPSSSPRAPAPALVDAQQPVGQLQVGERPQAQHCDAQRGDVLVAQDDPADRRRQRRED